MEHHRIFSINPKVNLRMDTQIHTPTVVQGDGGLTEPLPRVSDMFLHLPIPSSAETWKIVTKKVCQFFFA